MVQVAMNETKDLTTGDAARISRLSQQTIIRCCESGDLPCWRVPMSRFRRITRWDLYEWMKRHGIPMFGWPIEDLVNLRKTESERAREEGRSA